MFHKSRSYREQIVVLQESEFIMGFLESAEVVYVQRHR